MRQKFNAISKQPFFTHSCQRRVVLVLSSILRPPGGVPLRKASDGLSADDADVDIPFPAAHVSIWYSISIAITSPSITQITAIRTPTIVNIAAATGTTIVMHPLVNSRVIILPSTSAAPAPVTSDTITALFLPTVLVLITVTPTTNTHHHRHKVIAAAIRTVTLAATIITTARVISAFPSSPPDALASVGGCACRGAGVAGDVVWRMCYLPNGGGGGGGGIHWAAASAVPHRFAVTVSVSEGPAMLSPSHPGPSSSWAMLINNNGARTPGDASSLLPMTATLMISTSASGCGGVSGIPH